MRSWRTRAWLRAVSARRDERRGTGCRGREEGDEGWGYKRENMAGREREEVIDQNPKLFPIGVFRPDLPKNIPKNKKKKFELILFPKCPQILIRLRPWHLFVLNSPRLTSSWVYTGFRPTPPSVYPSGKSASMLSSGA